MDALAAELRERAAIDSFRRGRVASACAKVAASASGAARLYRIKADAVSRTVELLPDAVAVHDLALVASGVLGVFVSGIGGLHVPMHMLTPVAQALLLEKLPLSLRSLSRDLPTPAPRAGAVDAHAA